ncbi:hypothetical protein N7468_009911 [Penicillium chermesinum]|uniref:Allergen Asp f 4 n=1 Tax=Penicillium chermesinum TaxID=63820 RepID=A0A9W9TBS2_9EURO|nr:uncharacterized protein N7468_009911 [Penicillium chermesinum]KAJ5216903.1 hypothetical protein N7468_009911 [Penicillium chermesinum]KAJ6171484.1 hypothetical protein N7470_000551 [Penicillium chermesinum]
MIEATSIPVSERNTIKRTQIYSKHGFGQATKSEGSGVAYKGNVGNPYGSNIIRVSAESSKAYKYVAEFKTAGSDIWKVAIWNKFGPNGRLDGWFDHACTIFNLSSGQTQYVAFDDDSQGGWAAAPGESISVDDAGGYASTWGEFDFGSFINHGWSGFDVSAIAAQAGNLEVFGMKICDNITQICSSITPNAAEVDNAYIFQNRFEDGIGGNLPPGPVELSVTLGYTGVESTT